MPFTKRSATVFLILFGLIYFSLSIIFNYDELIKLSVLAFLLMLGGLVSFYWLFKAYLVLTHKHRYYWLILSIGVFAYTLSYGSWFINILVQRETAYPDLSFHLWLFCYLAFLTAIIYKIKLISTRISNSTFIFNIFIFVVFATSICIHFLITPLLSLLGESLTVTLIVLSYPIFSLCIFYATAVLYYLSKYSEGKKLIFFVVLGLSIYIVADWLYAYQTITETYRVGSFVDLMWLYGILMIGLGGLQAQSKNVIPKWEFKNYMDGKEYIVSYLSAIALMLLVVDSYGWNYNALSIGLTIIFVAIVVRQLYVLKSNKKLLNQFRYLAYHDPLTGLRNRSRFKTDLDKMIRITKQANYEFALLLIDLDRFKSVNDSLGHQFGDSVLKQVARRLKQTTTEKESIYRISGDEFIIMVPKVSTEHILHLANEILLVFQEPFKIDNYEIAVTPSIGISLYPCHGKTSGELFKRADVAMYHAKESGKNNAKLFNGELDDIISRKLRIENELQYAIEKNQFSIYYQPKVELATGKMIGTEALLRWHHPDLGVVLPDEFIPIAEESGQITKIGKWVLSHACKQNQAWNNRYGFDLCISVNVSVRQFQHNDFVQTVKDVIDETGVSPEKLQLEITESIMQNIHESTEVLLQLRAIGVKTAIDDFGKGYSSLHILQALPITAIKIDKLFIDDISSETNQSMVQTIVNLGLSLKLDVIAEGVEYEHQVKALLKYNCKLGQGYLYSRPVTTEEIEKILEKGPILSSYPGAV